MQTRNPFVAGAFYPGDSEELRRTIKNFLGKATHKVKTLGIVSPHAGYVYCGKTAAAAYNSIEPCFDTVVLLGPNHNGVGEASASSETWKTPLGSLKPDDDFIKEVIEGSVIMENAKAHWMEHSIEVQLPWLQYMFKDFKIVPISINPVYFDLDTCKEIGNKVAEVAKSLKRRILIVASSDFTHYGSMYMYEPFKGKTENILENVKGMDMEVINQILKLEPEKVVRICEEKRLTICGYGAIASMLFATKKLGAKRAKLMSYSTSFDVSKSTDAVVGYASINIY